MAVKWTQIHFGSFEIAKYTNKCKYITKKSLNNGIQ